MTIEKDVNIEGVRDILHFHGIFFVALTKEMQDWYMKTLKRVEKSVLQFNIDVTKFYDEVNEKALKFFDISVIDRIINIEKQNDNIKELRDKYYYEIYMEKNIYSEVKKRYKVQNIYWTAERYEEIVVLNRKIDKIYNDTLATLEELFDIIYKK